MCFPMYRVAAPSEYLVKTGLGIPTINIMKKGWVMPFQKCFKFDVTPINFTLSLHAMTLEKLDFVLPAVFTIGPRTDNMESLIRYVEHLVSDKDNDEALKHLVTGIVEGETRVLAASMTIEEIFKERKTFKEQVISHVQAELDQFGLYVYNGNVKELTDSEGSEYFKFQRYKTQEGAVNQAKVDVAEAKKKGDIGSKEREGLTRRETSRIECQSYLYETQRQIEMNKASTDYQVQQAEYDRRVKVSQVEAQKATEIREIELKRSIETKRLELETERLRAKDFAKAVVDYESAVKLADSKLYSVQKEAQGIQAMYHAQAEGILRIVEAFNGDPESAVEYLMLEQGMFEDLAITNASAIKGLSPNITVWNTTSGGESSAAKFIQQLPPLFSTIQKQTGMTPPSWMVELPGQVAAPVASDSKEGHST